MDRGNRMTNSKPSSSRLTAHFSVKKSSWRGNRAPVAERTQKESYLASTRNDLGCPISPDLFHSGDVGIHRTPPATFPRVIKDDQSNLLGNWTEPSGLKRLTTDDFAQHNLHLDLSPFVLHHHHGPRATPAQPEMLQATGSPSARSLPRRGRRIRQIEHKYLSLPKEVKWLAACRVCALLNQKNTPGSGQQGCPTFTAARRRRFACLSHKSRDQEKRLPCLIHGLLTGMRK